jgi:hypothetical protein
VCGPNANKRVNAQDDKRQARGEWKHAIPGLSWFKDSERYWDPFDPASFANWITK